MRRLSVLSFALLSACASRVEQAPAPPPAPAAPVVTGSGWLVGKTAADLIATFGSPALQIREGSSLKLQFRSTGCILDAYLYPSAGILRVRHVDARTRSGADLDQAACIADFSTPN